MNKEKIIACEKTKIEKWSQFQLHNRWKVIGIWLCLAVFVTLIGLKLIDTDYKLPKDIMSRLLLVGLLIIILAKEKVEDELLQSLRAKAFTLAFIFGVIYALVQPFIDFVVHNLLYPPSVDNGFSYFQLLSFMLVIQIMFFEILKRNR
jgi:DMSO/TMAO reductase YedYZ heme-binding membrane subunit